MSPVCFVNYLTSLYLNTSTPRQRGTRKAHSVSNFPRHAQHARLCRNHRLVIANARQCLWQSLYYQRLMGLLRLFHSLAKALLHNLECLGMPGASSASSIRRGGPASPPPCRLDIIFVLEMVLNQRQTISHGHACQRGTQKTVFYFQKIIIYQRADDGFFIFEQINGIFCFIEIQINAGMSA